jgi:hypothetical protein
VLWKTFNPEKYEKSSERESGGQTHRPTLRQTIPAILADTTERESGGQTCSPTMRKAIAAILADTAEGAT